MKKLIIIFSLLGIGLCSYGQVREKWIDTDSLDAETIVLDGSELNIPLLADTNFVNTKISEIDTVQVAVKSDTAGYYNTDTLTTNQLTISGGAPINSTVSLSDISVDVSNVTYNDTLLFNNVNWLITPDSSYATNKSWVWLYNLGGN